MASKTLIPPMLKFTDMLLFNVVICIHTSNVDVSGTET